MLQERLLNVEIALSESWSVCVRERGAGVGGSDEEEDAVVVVLAVHKWV